jgi:hypothetical protein
MESRLTDGDLALSQVVYSVEDQMTAPLRLTMLGLASVGLCIGIVDCAGSSTDGSGVADAMGGVGISLTKDTPSLWSAHAII